MVQYSGPSGAVVIGSVSGKIYRFAGPGSRVEIDPRDRASLAAALKVQKPR